MLEKEKKLRSFNIQLFAEDGGEDKGGEDKGGEDKKSTPTLESLQETINKLVSENDNLKKAKDKLSSENAEKKRKLQEKLTDEERKKAQDEELKEQYEQTIKKLEDIETSEKFTSNGFSKEEANEIVKGLRAGTIAEQAEAISKIISEKMKKQQKDFDKKLSEKIYTPTPKGDGAEHKAKANKFASSFAKTGTII